MHADTLRETAQTMRSTIKGEYPTGPAQTGAFNATLTWAIWCEQQAALADAELPDSHQDN